RLQDFLQLVTRHTRLHLVLRREGWQNLLHPTGALVDISDPRFYFELIHRPLSSTFLEDSDVSLFADAYPTIVELAVLVPDRSPVSKEKAGRKLPSVRLCLFDVGLSMFYVLPSSFDILHPTLDIPLQVQPSRARPEAFDLRAGDVGHGQEQVRGRLV